MSMYNDASLALIPSAVGDGVVYNARPVEVLGAEMVTNGDFTTDSNWTKDTGWTISGGLLNCNAASSNNTRQSISGYSTSKSYRVTFTISNYVSGGAVIYLGYSIGTTRTANGTYTEYLSFADSGAFNGYLRIFSSGASQLSIDNVSIKETSAQDFDFTRASEATRVLSGGRIEKVRTNILTYSNDFSNAAWIKSNATLGNVVSGPLAGVSGRAVTISAGGLLYSYGTTPLSLGVASAYMRCTSGSVELRIGDPQGNPYETKTISTSWERYSFLDTTDLRGFAFYNPSASSINIEIAAVQLEQGLVATEYIATTSTSVSVGSVNDMPRLDWSGGCPALLLEPSRTNLLENSEYILGADWNQLGGALSLAQNTTDTLSPEGKYNAGAITLSTTSNRYFSSKGYNLGGLNNISASVWLKSDGADIECALAFFNGTGGDAITITNEWQRFEMNKTSNNSTEYVGLDFRGAGYATSGIVYCYGWQFENNASYTTSYIPTYGTATTRAAGACLKTGVSSLINSVEGTLYFESSALTDDLSSTVAFSISDGTATNAVRMGYQQGADVFFAESSGTSNNIGIYSVAVSVTSRNKFALRYKENDAKLYINGSVAASDTVFTAFAAATFNRIAFDKGDGTLDFLGNVNQVLYFPTALSDTELEKLTTL